MIYYFDYEMLQVQKHQLRYNLKIFSALHYLRENRRLLSNAETMVRAARNTRVKITWKEGRERELSEDADR